MVVSMAAFCEEASRHLPPLLEPARARAASLTFKFELPFICSILDAIAPPQRFRRQLAEQALVV